MIDRITSLLSKELLLKMRKILTINQAHVWIWFPRRLRLLRDTVILYVRRVYARGFISSAIASRSRAKCRCISNFVSPFRFTLTGRIILYLVYGELWTALYMLNELEIEYPYRAFSQGRIKWVSCSSMGFISHTRKSKSCVITPSSWRLLKISSVSIFLWYLRGTWNFSQIFQHVISIFMRPSLPKE